MNPVEERDGGIVCPESKLEIKLDPAPPENEHLKEGDIESRVPENEYLKNRSTSFGVPDLSELDGADQD